MKKQKKLLTGAYKSVFNNRILTNVPGSGKFNKELGRLGRMEEWDGFVREEYKAHRRKFLAEWCRDNDVEMICDI